MSQNGFTSAKVKESVILAHISKDPDINFLQKYELDIAKVLDYIEELNEVNTSDIRPLDGLSVNNIDDLREDIADSDREKYIRVRSLIINGFPNKQGDLLEIPGIF